LKEKIKKKKVFEEKKIEKVYKRKKNGFFKKQSFEEKKLKRF
jgi:hypothetical protein